MNIFRNFCILCLVIFSLIFVSESFASSTYTVSYLPAMKIYMTGQSLSAGIVQARFDVAKALSDSGSAASGAFLNTNTKNFSGVFYLSGAGWVDMTGVKMDCGVQVLSALSVPCSLSGVAQSETIGDITFDGVNKKIQYLPSFGTLSGSISSNIGTFSLSGAFLPLLPAEFTDMTVQSGVVSRTTDFLIKNPNNYSSTTRPWRITFTPSGSSYSPAQNKPDGHFILDMSLASTYDIVISDPNRSTTTYMGYYTTHSDVPAMFLTTATLIKNFCISYPVDSRCPDGPSLSPTVLAKNPSSTPVVGDSTSTYNFTLKLRDKYGNLVNKGKIKISYKTTANIVQTIFGENSNYSPSFPGEGLDFTSGMFNNSLGGKIETVDMPLAGVDIGYSISSDAPTDSSANTLSLSGITYTDTNLVKTNIPNLDKTPLIFTPWFTTGLSAGPGDIVVGRDHIFTTIDNTPSTPNATLQKIYGMFVGDNLTASFDNLKGISNQKCSKNYDTIVDASVPDECAWSSMNGSNFPAVIATNATSFSGTYTPHTIDPDLENVSYFSYIKYDINGNTVIYPSNSGPLGTSVYDDSAVKIIGQNNVGKQYGGIDSENNAEKWNALHEQAMKLSRNRSDYSDVNYELDSTDQSIDNTFFTSGNPKKRTLIVVGKNITITGDILKNPNYPLAVVALADKNGNGGNIVIDPSVRDISASLFAEHAIRYSGSPAINNNQLFVFGSVVSRNTMGETAAKICPFFVTSMCDEPTAKKYDLEKLREGFTLLPVAMKPLHQSTSSDAATYPNTSLIIEYDGRVERNPPPGF